MVILQARLRKALLVASAIPLAAAFLALVPPSAAPEKRDLAVEKSLRRDVEILASPKMEGRLAKGTKGDVPLVPLP